MTGTALQCTLIRVQQIVRGVMTIGLLLGATLTFAQNEENTLLVWAGDKAHEAPDFLAVVDLDSNSPRYGKIVRIVPLPAGVLGTGAVANEPHHAGLSSDGRTLALGGLLSFLRGQPQVFFFDVSQPRHPKFINSNNPPNASITDEFASLGNGGFLATFMGGPGGAHPGRVVEYDAHLNVVQTLSTPMDDAQHPFNPHGISIDEVHNLMVTSDYVCPVSTLHIGGGMPHLDGSIRVWDLAKRSVIRTIVVGDHVGTMDVRLIPGDTGHRAFTAGMNDNQLYLVDTQGGTAKAVFDFSSYAVQAVPNPPIWPQLLLINRAGTRLFITLNFAGQAGKVVMLDISDPEHPQAVGDVDLGLNSGPHYLRLTSGETRLVVSDYFLVEDLVPSGVINAEGDMKIHVINVFTDHLELDKHFNLDFSHDIPTGPAHPHAVVLLPGPGD
jgi:56kDa selenium binding protein (SBP56)